MTALVSEWVLIPECPAEGSGDLQLFTAEVCDHEYTWTEHVGGFFVGVGRLLLGLVFVHSVTQMGQYLDRSSCQPYSAGIG